MISISDSMSNLQLNTNVSVNDINFQGPEPSALADEQLPTTQAQIDRDIANFPVLRRTIMNQVGDPRQNDNSLSLIADDFSSRIHANILEDRRQDVNDRQTIVAN